MIDADILTRAVLMLATADDEVQRLGLSEGGGDTAALDAAIGLVPPEFDAFVRRMIASTPDLDKGSREVNVMAALDMGITLGVLAAMIERGELDDLHVPASEVYPPHEEGER